MAEQSMDTLVASLQGAFAGRSDGLRRVLEAVIQAAMAEEVQRHVGAAPHERAAGRAGHRNGYKPRTVQTRVGDLELAVPQVRGCEAYHPSMFAKWQRSERALLVACSEMYFQGVSTRNVREVLSAMCDGDVSAMTVSRVAAEVDERLATFRDRRLGHTAWPYLMVDARYEKVRVDGRVVSRAVLVVVGFTAQGRREVLDWRVGDSEAEAFWGQLFRDLIAPGDRAECLRRAGEAADKWRAAAPAVAAMFEDGLADCLTVLSVPEHHRKSIATMHSPGPATIICRTGPRLGIA